MAYCVAPTLYVVFCFSCSGDHRDLHVLTHSFPTRSYSELIPEFNRLLASENLHEARHVKQSRKIIAMYNPLLETIDELLKRGKQVGVFRGDRKSTRLNSSH